VIALNPPLPQTTNGPELFTFFSSTNPLLQSNSSYWIVLEPVILNLSDSTNDAIYGWQDTSIVTSNAIFAYYDSSTNGWEQWNLGLPFLHSPGLRVVGSQVDTLPPVITANAVPATLWPPNGKQVAVTVSGNMVDDTSGIDPSTATYSVIDEYGDNQPHGPVVIDANGDYSFTVWLEASRDGHDLNGRTYIISVNAQDDQDNTGWSQINVVVPHDLSKQTKGKRARQ